MHAADLEKDIAAYDARRMELQKSYGDQWVVFFEGAFKGAYRTYDQAINFALAEFGDADFLVRRIVERPVTIPMLVVDK